jgi:hypothetical protein
VHQWRQWYSDVCDVGQSVCLCVGVVCLSLSPPFPEKPSLLADIGQCAGPIRLRRTLAADFSLAASLGWRPRLASISAKRFFAGKAGGDTFTNPTLRRLVRSAVSAALHAEVRRGFKLAFTRYCICSPCENSSHLLKARRWIRPPATRNTVGQNGMVEARRKSAGGGAAAADGKRSPRRGAFPGARPSRVGAGRRSPGMRRQPLPQADTKRMTTRRGHVAWQRELDVFTRQKNARARLREGGRPT